MMVVDKINKNENCNITRLPLFLILFCTKSISNVMRVFLNKQFLRLQSTSALFAYARGRVRRRFLISNVSESGKIIQSRALLPASYGLDGGVLFHVLFLL